MGNIFTILRKKLTLRGQTMSYKYTVYMHITPNNMAYVGATSQDYKLRWQNGTGYRKQELFYTAIQKYGWDNMEHIILAEDLPQDEALQLERDMIAYWNTTDRDHGYNIEPGGYSGNLGMRHTKAARSKMAKSHTGLPGSNKGIPMSEEQRCKLSRHIVQYTIDGEYIQEWSGIRKAARTLGLCINGISNCCKGKLSTSGGFIWKFK